MAILKVMWMTHAEEALKSRMGPLQSIDFVLERESDKGTGSLPLTFGPS